MNSIPVFYATTEGHTRRIAETIAVVLREQGFESEAVRLSRNGAMPAWPAWPHVVTAVVGGSLHAGRHQSEVGAFVTRQLDELNRRPTAFFSVSLSAASADPSKAQVARDIAERFVRKLHWRPRRVVCIAGKLAYRQYGFLTRWMMRRIAAHEGGPTDTSRDHDLTDWGAVKTFALDVAADARRRLQLDSSSPAA